VSTARSNTSEPRSKARSSNCSRLSTIFGRCRNVSSRRYSPVGSVGGFTLRRPKKKISSEEFLIFNQELATLLRAGLPLVQSLDILRRRVPNPAFKRVLDDVYERVRSGNALSDAFEAQGGMFTGIYHASLMAGEKSGSLETVLRRYVARHNGLFDDMFRRSNDLTDDPLQSFLVGLKFFADMLADLPKTHPGCVVAAFCYQDQQFSRDIRALSAEGIRSWREKVRTHLQKIADTYPPRNGADLDAMADMIAAVVEGGIILSRTFDDNRLLAQQVMAYRNYVKLAFEPEMAK